MNIQAGLVNKIQGGFKQKTQVSTDLTIRAWYEVSVLSPPFCRAGIVLIASFQRLPHKGEGGGRRRNNIIIMAPKTDLFIYQPQTALHFAYRL